MFLKYNLRALNYSVESLQPVPETFRYPNSQKRDLRDSDEGEDEKLGGGANPIFPIFPIPISAKLTFISGKSGNSFSRISPSLITLGHMLLHNLYINVLIALILVYRNSM